MNLSGNINEYKYLCIGLLLEFGNLSTGDKINTFKGLPLIKGDVSMILGQECVKINF